MQKVSSESVVSSAEEEKKVESGDQNITTNTTTDSTTNSTNSTLNTVNTVNSTNNVFSFAAAAAALTTTNTTTDSAPGTPLRAELTENEVTIIAQLTEMFASKHGRQPSADEVC